MPHTIRRLPLFFLAALLFSAVSVRIAAAEKKDSAQPTAGQGIMVGEVTPTSALVQVRLTTTDKLVKGDVPGMAGVVSFYLWQLDENNKLITPNIAAQTVHAEPKHDFIARAKFENLKPGTNYRVGASIRPSKVVDPSATFRTLPGPKQSKEVRFVVVTGMNYAKFHGDDRIDRKRHKIENNTELPKPYAGKDKHLGYPGLASILKQKPHFFVGTGDNVYYDTPKTVTELRRKWHEQFVQPRYRKLFAAVPTYWMIDDHDYRVDDCDNTGDYKPSPETGRRMMLEQLPIAPQSSQGFRKSLGTESKTYRTHRVSRELQIWFPENRMYRSPNSMPDGPKKSIWGAEQKAWLKRTLKASDATFKLLISPTPMIGPDDLRKKDNHTNIGGFRHERDEFFGWLKQTGLDKRNFFIICGDRHWQYHSIHPTGIEEFSCGALVDANSRLGRKPGDPKSTDPKGRIKQVYAQKKRSAGFLMVTVTPGDKGNRPRLTFDYFDEHGKRLHRHVK